MSLLEDVVRAMDNQIKILASQNQDLRQIIASRDQQIRDLYRTISILNTDRNNSNRKSQTLSTHKSKTKVLLLYVLI